MSVAFEAQQIATNRQSSFWKRNDDSSGIFINNLSLLRLLSKDVQRWCDENAALIRKRFQNRNLSIDRYRNHSLSPMSPNYVTNVSRFFKEDLVDVS